MFYVYFQENGIESKNIFFSLQMQKAMQQTLSRLSSNAYLFGCLFIMQIFLSCSSTMIEQEQSNNKMEWLCQYCFFSSSYSLKISRTVNHSTLVGPKSDHCLALSVTPCSCRDLTDMTLACED